MGLISGSGQGAGVEHLCSSAAMRIKAGRMVLRSADESAHNGSNGVCR